MDDIKGIEISDITRAGAALTKLLDVVSRGIGVCYEPIHKKRMAKATACEIKILSDAINENYNLPIHFNDSTLSINATSFKELTERTKSRLLFQEINKQQNIEAIVTKACEEIALETNVSKEPVETDWILRFFNCIEDISNEDMQEIWGKILAGEVKKPNTYSYRTLETLKNLTQSEALLFEQISQYVFTNNIIYMLPNDEECLNECGINYASILKLIECNLITPSSTATYVSKLEKGKRVGLWSNGYIILFENETENTINIKESIYVLSEVGIQLFRTINVDTNRDENYVKKYCMKLKEKYINCTYTLHKVNHIDFFEEGINVDYNEENILEPKDKDNLKQKPE